MKIELKYEGKNYYDPKFIFFWNDQCDNFGIGIKFNPEKNYQFIIDDIMNNIEDFKINETSFYYYTKYNVYAFNLNESFKLVPRNKNFSHCVVILDKDDKIEEQQYKSFECLRDENSN